MIKRILIALLAVSLFYSCHVGRFFIYNFSDIRDYKKFPEKPLKKSGTPFYFKEAPSGTASLKLPKLHRRKKEIAWEEALRKSGTVAFLVIRNDSILYQWYRPGRDQSMIVPSFSMAKSYVSALVGIAIGEGAIKSAGEPITNYLDYLDKNKFGKITIQHLLDMRSGLRSIENYYNPFGDVAKYYYGRKLKKYTHRLKIKEEPGKKFEYISLNTQLLGLIVEKATGKGLTEYLQEKIWSQIGTEFDAGWSIDSKKYQTEKAFCCINARARDFAKFGRLYLRKGNWDGRQIVPEAWVEASSAFRFPKNNYLYSNQWWHTRSFYPAKDSSRYEKPYALVTSAKKGKDPASSYIIRPDEGYYAEGHLGQFIFISPSKNMVMVRLGKKYGGVAWSQLFEIIATKN
jgi:CubicO group peptidase (beta-lactamase class C family)